MTCVQSNVLIHKDKSVVQLANFVITFQQWTVADAEIKVPAIANPELSKCSQILHGVGPLNELGHPARHHNQLMQVSVSSARGPWAPECVKLRTVPAHFEERI